MWIHGGTSKSLLRKPCARIRSQSYSSVQSSQRNWLCLVLHPRWISWGTALFCQPYQTRGKCKTTENKIKKRGTETCSGICILVDPEVLSFMNFTLTIRNIIMPTQNTYIKKLLTMTFQAAKCTSGLVIVIRVLTLLFKIIQLEYTVFYCNHLEYTEI